MPGIQAPVDESPLHISSCSGNTALKNPDQDHARRDSIASSDTQPSDQHTDAHQKVKPDTDDSRPDMLHRATTTTSQAEPLHSVFTKNQKLLIVCMASWAAFFSPISATIYLPALNALAADLRVSNSLINLTLTSYMIFQGLAPAFIGNLADAMGRRPAYLVCFIIYISANIGLALQNSYAALFILRCLQSSGSSATIAMASAVVSDIATPSERGKYMGFTFAGSLLGPAFGPVVGGVLTQFLSWRAIFWFLAIFAGAFLTVFGLFFPETARSIVGNGSIPAKGLNMSLMNYLAIRKVRREATENTEATQTDINDDTRARKSRARFPNPFSSLKIIFDKSNALLLFYNAFLFAAFYDVTATIPSQFAKIYHFNEIQIGLCYIPSGAGSLFAALVNGQLLDRNFRRWCKKLGVNVKKGRNQDLRNFPIERVRLEIALPAVYLSICFLLIFGWVLNFHGPMAVLLVILFFTSFSMTVAFNITSTLLVDFYPGKPATATAANNLVRCLLGAGATGLIVPMINGMGLGWTYTLLSLFLLVTSPMLWVLIWKGMDWRKLRTVREEEKERAREMNRAGMVEETGESDRVTIEKTGTHRNERVNAGGLVEMAAAVEEEREMAQVEVLKKS